MKHGQRFVPEELDTTYSFLEIYERFKGMIAHIADYYKVSRSTVYKYLKENENIQRQCDDLYDQVELDMLNQAELVYRQCLRKVDENPKLALLAARYTMESVGHKKNKGNKNPPRKDNGAESHLESISKWTDQTYEQIHNHADE